MEKMIGKTVKIAAFSSIFLAWICSHELGANAATAVVEMKNLSFVPNTVTIQEGDTVRWLQKDTTAHDTVSTTSLWKSALLSLNGTFEFTFSKAGTFSYFCTPHRSFMTGTVKVNPAAPVNQPPKVAIQTPKDGEVATEPFNGVISVDATDSDGTIANVEILVNGVVVASVAKAPFVAPILGAAAGTYVIAAKATDNGGAATTSASVTFTVKAAKTAARIENPALLPDGRFQFNVTGSLGESYSVEGSLDLGIWSVLATRTSPFTFVDDQTKAVERRFFRVR